MPYFHTMLTKTRAMISGKNEVAWKRNKQLRFYTKFDKFCCISLSHFIKDKPLIYDEWTQTGFILLKSLLIKQNKSSIDDSWFVTFIFLKSVLKYERNFLKIVYRNSWEIEFWRSDTICTSSFSHHNEVFIDPCISIGPRTCDSSRKQRQSALKFEKKFNLRDMCVVNTSCQRCWTFFQF